MFSKPIDWSDYKYCFVYGQTDPTLFDHGRWRLCAHQALGSKDFSTLTADYYDQDDAELVEFIARQPSASRDHRACDEILVTVGAQNALWLGTGLAGAKEKGGHRKSMLPCIARNSAPNTKRRFPTDVDAQGYAQTFFQMIRILSSPPPAIIARQQRLSPLSDAKHF